MDNNSGNSQKHISDRHLVTMNCLENNEYIKNYQSKDNNLLFYLVENSDQS